VAGISSAPVAWIWTALQTRQLCLVREPEELVTAVPGVAFRATPLRAGPFEASLATFGLGGGVALQTGRCTPLLAFAQAAPGTAVLQLPLEGA
jgi:AraC family transcriptional regulator, ethanolamine operon transcriptional activator